MNLFPGLYSTCTDYTSETGIVGALNALFQRVVTANATASATTLSGASIVGGILNRTVSTGGAYNDTTDTAANIIGAIGNNVPAGWAGTFRYLNGTAGTATLVAGTGVTISGTATIANGAWRDYLILVTASASQGGTAAVSLTNIGGGTL